MRTLEQVAGLLDDAIQAAAAEPRRLCAFSVTDAEPREATGAAPGRLAAGRRCCHQRTDR